MALRAKIWLACRIAFNVGLGIYILTSNRFSAEPRFGVIGLACALFLYAFGELMSDLLVRNGRIDLSDDRIYYQQSIKPSVDQPLANVVQLVIPHSFLGLSTSKRIVVFANRATIEFDASIGGYRQLIKTLEQRTGMRFSAISSTEASPV